MTKDPYSKRRVAVSMVELDGTMVETVHRTDLAQTSFIIAAHGAMQSGSEYSTDGISYVPISAENNLIKHNALLLPSEPIEYGSSEELLQDIKGHIARYVVLSDEALSISAAYVLLTWVYDAFNELPYLRFRGDYGTGKTRALIVVGSLTYKAFFASGASTVSPIFHALDTWRGTLIFDEADFRFTDEKAELVKILNNGNTKGFPVLRTQVTQQHTFNPQAFVIFGPKIVGMRRSYDDRALESRFLTVEMEPGRLHGIPINLPDQQKLEALTLRNKLLMYRLRNRQKAAIDPSLADSALEARMNQILLPLLSVISSEALRAVILASAQTAQSGIIADRSASAEGQVLKTVVQLQSERGADIVSVGEVSAAFSVEYGCEYERPITNRWIGSVIRRLGLSLYKRNGNFVLVPGQDERIKLLAARYGISNTDTCNKTLASQGDRDVGTYIKGIQ